MVHIATFLDTGHPVTSKSYPFTCLVQLCPLIIACIAFFHTAYMSCLVGLSFPLDVRVSQVLSNPVTYSYYVDARESRAPDPH